MPDPENRLRTLRRYRLALFCGRTLMLVLAVAAVVWMIILTLHESVGTMSFACSVACALGGASIWAGVRLGRTSEQVVAEIHELTRRVWSS